MCVVGFISKLIICRVSFTFTQTFLLLIMPNNKKNRSKKTKPSKATSKDTKKPSPAEGFLMAARDAFLGGLSLAQIKERKDRAERHLANMSWIDGYQQRIADHTKASIGDVVGEDRIDGLIGASVPESVKEMRRELEGWKKHLERLNGIIAAVEQLDRDLAYLRRKEDKDDDASGGPFDGGCGMAV